MPSLFFNCLGRLGRLLYAWHCLAAVHFQKNATQPLRFAQASDTLNRALAATSWWLAMEGSASIDRRLRHLIELGADPSVQNWLPVRMAACAGRADTVVWLAQRCVPSQFAIDDARDWAKRNNHAAALAALTAL